MAASLVRRVDGLLTWNRACFWAGVLCVLYVAAYAYVLIDSRPPLNSSGTPIGGDYIAFHAAGRLLLSGDAGHLYDHERIAAIQNSLLDGHVPGFYDAFRNPPFVAVVFAPLALLDLVPGFALWTVLSLACLGAAIWLVLDEIPSLKPRWLGLLVLVFAFAPVYFGLIDGENATVSLLLYVLLYRALVTGQAGRAGVWAALGLFKPQLFVVFPLIFLAQRSGRALLSYGVVAVGLAASSLILVGAEGVQAWLRTLVEPESGNALANAWRMASLKSLTSTILPGQASLALGLYLAACVVGGVGVFRLWSNRRIRPELAWISTSLVAVLVDPHLVDYDLSVLVPAGVLAAAYLPSMRWGIAALFLLLLFRVQVPLGEGELQLSVLALAAYLGGAWYRLRAVGLSC